MTSTVSNRSRSSTRSSSGRSSAKKRATSSGRSSAKTRSSSGRSAAKKRATSSGRSSAKKRSTASRSGSRTRSSSQTRASHRAGVGERSSRGSSARSGRRTGSKRRALKVTEAGERYAAYLLTVFVGLTLFGLVMVLSASSVPSVHQFNESPLYQFSRQAAWAGVGAVAFLVASRIDYRLVRHIAGPLLLLCFTLLVVVLIPGIGINVNGSTRWLGYGSFVIQPAELTKLALIIFAADLLARRERRMDRPELTVRPIMITVCAASVLLLQQPKLGTPVILGTVSLIMLFIAGARIRSLLLWASASAAGVLFIAMVTGYQRARIDGWLDPWANRDGSGFQAVQSQLGIASGGLFGVGLGASRAKWGFLPEAQTDFIFAVVAEEIGLIGASALIGAFILVAWMGIKAALAAPDRFGMLLAAGITCWLLVQAFLNIGMVLGVLPITGEPLPFVSAGGSSLITALTAAGLLTSVARRARD